MEMANFWIKEKQYIHKLFKVLVPRFQNCPLSYTRMYKAPKTYPDHVTTPRAVLELRGNPYPALKPDLRVNRNFIHNVLLDEARKEYRRKKYAELIGNTETEDHLEDVNKLVEQLEGTEIKETESETSDAPKKNE